MDMSCAIVIDSNYNTDYYVQIGNKYYSSRKFYKAAKNKSPLRAKDLIEEDHYQIVRTLDELCEGRKDLTEETKFMLKILRSSNTIEHAIY
jgi:hypothetical protein